jgi:hypothetical protein
MKSRLVRVALQSAVQAIIAIVVLFALLRVFHVWDNKDLPSPMRKAGYSIRLLPAEFREALGPFVKGMEINFNEEKIFQIGNRYDWIIFLDSEMNAGATVIPVYGNGQKSAPASDINDDGYPELTIEMFSGGARCCNEYFVIQLKDKKAIILRNIWGGNASLILEDLDADGKAELVTADDCSAYWRTSFAGSPMGLIIFRWKDGSYVLATKDYKEYRQEERVEQESALIEIKAGRGDRDSSFFFEFDDDRDIPTLLLGIMLNYIYIGEWKKAVSIFRQYPKRESTRRIFVDEFLKEIQDSRYWQELLRMDPSLKDMAYSIKRK